MRTHFEHPHRTPRQFHGTASKDGVQFELPHGNALFVEGDVADRFYRVREGALTEYRSLSDGRRQVVAIYYPDDYIGITSNDRYEFSADAACRSVVEPIPRQDFATRLARDPDLVNKVITQFVERLSHSQAHLVLLGRMSAIERVSSFLLQLKRRAEAEGDVAQTIPLPVSRTDMADYLGLTTETVSRCLSLLKWKKAIAMPNARHVRILDEATLDSLAYARNGLGDWIYHA